MMLNRLPGIYVNIAGKKYKTKPIIEERPVAILYSSNDGNGNTTLSISSGFRLKSDSDGNGNVTLLVPGYTLTSSNSNGNVKLEVR